MKLEPKKERLRPESKRKKVSFTTGTRVAELARRTMLGTLSSEPLSFSISPIVAHKHSTLNTLSSHANESPYRTTTARVFLSPIGWIFY